MPGTAWSSPPAAKPHGGIRDAARAGVGRVDRTKRSVSQMTARKAPHPGRPQIGMSGRLRRNGELRHRGGAHARRADPGRPRTGKGRKDMPFIASNGLTEAGTSRTVAAAGMNVHYHDVGEGEPVLFLHSYGPGTTAWITFHKTVGVLSTHFRCILMDLPNFSKTGPIVYREGVHAVQARTAVALLDALGIARAHWVGNSQGGQSAMVAAITYPERVGKFVMGGSHIGTGGDRYLLANRPSEGSRATQAAIADPSRENIRRYLRVHIDDESLVTDRSE